MSEAKGLCPEVRFASLAPWVWEGLADLLRSGWVNRKVSNPESVQKHILSLRILAFEIAPFTGQDLEDLLDMLEVHDYPEAIHGDEVIAMADQEERKRLKAIKAQKEMEAMVHICKPLGHSGERMLALWLRFEYGLDPVASFARQLDKYQAVAKSLEYEESQNIRMFSEFLEYALDYITHDLLLERLTQLKEKWLSLPLARKK